MLNKFQIKAMARLEMYEKKEGKKDFGIISYYCKDYVELNLLISFFWVTLGYICICAMAGIVGLRLILDNLSIALLVTMGTIVVFAYLMILVVYLWVASIVYNRRYEKAKSRARRYYYVLSKLLKSYERERHHG